VGKKVILIIMLLLLLLVLFPVLGSEAFADFIGTGPLSMKLLIEPVNMLLLGIGLTFIGTRA
jgi:hypothetical protein